MLNNCGIRQSASGHMQNPGSQQEESILSGLSLASLLDTIKIPLNLKYLFSSGVRHYYDNYAQLRSQWGPFLDPELVSEGPFAEPVVSAGSHMQNPRSQRGPICRTHEVKGGAFLASHQGPILS